MLSFGRINLFVRPKIHPHFPTFLVEPTLFHIIWNFLTSQDDSGREMLAEYSPTQVPTADVCELRDSKRSLGIFRIVANEHRFGPAGRICAISR